MKQLLSVCAAILTTLSLTASFAADVDLGIDGKRWSEITFPMKVFYLSGLIDGGMDARLAIMATLEENDPMLEVVFEDRTGVLGLTVGDRVKALDSFYSDYKNIFIEVPAALRIIGMQINGSTEKEVQEALSHIRSVSNPTAERRAQEMLSKPSIKE